ncbi:MAG TPA: hypothetical protein VNV86_02770 [Candidatus Acidoferrum sp.]|nr:hypothetical protein [Candidatus Acidoferrum sp.]
MTCAAFAADGDKAGDDPPAKSEPVVAVKAPQPDGVEWTELGVSSFRFLALMHGFRLATEPGTRASGAGLGAGYTGSVGNLHGWADGDPFYVNYVGHPMQGAVSGRLWLMHDRRYRRAEFGSSADYWKGKLRAAAFAWALSEQFEIGPLSEASIGHTQKDFPQQGFVDHVVTPTVGMGWMVAEDVLDRYLIKRIEARTNNTAARIMARTFLNPARSFASLMDWRAPWHRDSREGILTYTPAPAEIRTTASGRVSEPTREIAPFEFTATASAKQLGDGACVGGGAEGAYRVAPDWQVVLAVNGCKRLGETANVSGDALLYQLGPRWTPMATGKWSPFAHLLVGGLKMTQEVMDPAEKQLVLEANKNLDPMLDYTLHGKYTTQQESNSLALTAGVGVDYKLNPALAIRVASLEYLRGSAGIANASGFQMTTGMVLRWGTW